VSEGEEGMEGREGPGKGEEYVCDCMCYARVCVCLCSNTSAVL